MKYFCLSDVGIVRPENQDRVGVVTKDEWVLAMLCDGMGGHFGGSKAASISIKTFEDYFKNNFPGNVNYNDKHTINEWFINALAEIKKQLIEAAEEDPTFKDMGTTLTAALIYPSEKLIYVFNVGDSRTYIYNGLLHQVTMNEFKMELWNIRRPLNILLQINLQVVWVLIKLWHLMVLFIERIQIPNMLF